MRVALLTRRFDPHGGGTERDLIVTAECLRASGHHPVIFAGEVRGTVEGFPVHRVPRLPLGRTAALLSFAYRAPIAARRAGADLILSFARTVGADVMRSGGSAHISYVRAARQWRGALAWNAMRVSPYHRAQMFIERRGFTSSNLRLAIAVSNLVRDDLMREFRLPASKAVTLYNGVDLDRFTPPRDGSARRELRSSIGIADNVPIVAFVGNGWGRKGLRFLIGAWPKVARVAHLIVVGADQNARWYQRQAMRLGLGSRIHFVGPMPDVTRIFHAVDAVALPSLFEPFGNVILEAMASGAPVLSSAQSGASELMPEPMRRFIVHDPTNTDEIAQKMNALLEVSGDLRGLARATAEKFTWRDYAENLQKIISAAAQPQRDDPAAAR
ncbi:MAG TPA: glycosyltransferase family 4 protein [Candidatus Binataceae bacterium]|nr:glycosyltransferase family 4 protein [Candidatus Binataceae bacterium]